jgi:hypothetical protein
MPAIASEVEEALREGVDINFLCSPIAVTKPGGKRLRLNVRNRLGKLGPDGRKIPVP